MKTKIQWYKECLVKAKCSSKGGWVKMANRYAVQTGQFAPVGNKREARRVLAQVFGEPPPGTIRNKKTEHQRTVGKPPPRYINPNTDAFLESYEWRRVRMEALKLHGARCQCCGATPSDGLRMHVDHIKPRRLFPNLALDLTNLQVLCEVCNHGKGNWDATDWRDPVDGDADTWLAHMREIARKE